MKLVIWTVAGVGGFYLLYSVASRLDTLWLSFPLFCLGLLGMGFAGHRIKRLD